jgi:hypothetical protein
MVSLRGIFKGKPKKDDQKTKQQVPNKAVRPAISGNKNEIPSPCGRDIEIWRRMRMDPTIALARAIANAPIRSAEWAIEVDEDAPEGAKEMLEDMLDETWRGLMSNAIFSRDYGWQAFELIFGVADSHVVVDRFKPLVPEITQVVTDKHGNYLGLWNGKSHSHGINFSTGQDQKGVFLPAPKTLWVTNEKEGDNYYGESFMERARIDWEAYLKIRAKGDRYATTVSGPIPYVTFPDSESKDINGSSDASSLFAKQILDSLQAAVGVAIPMIEHQWTQQAIESGVDPSKLRQWEIGFIEHNNKAGDEFLSFERARDVGKLRAWLVPERAATEGQYGTKAEAETHAGVVMEIADLFLDDFVEHFNKHVTRMLMRVNFGEGTEKQAKVVIQRTDPVKAQLLREMIKSLYGAPVNLDVFEDTANVQTIFEMLGIPVLDDIEQRITERDEEEPEDNMPDQLQPDDPENQEETEEELSLEHDEPQEGEVREFNGQLYKYEDGAYVPAEVVEASLTPEDGEQRTDDDGNIFKWSASEKLWNPVQVTEAINEED